VGRFGDAGHPAWRGRGRPGQQARTVGEADRLDVKKVGPFCPSAAIASRRRCRPVGSGGRTNPEVAVAGIGSARMMDDCFEARDGCRESRDRNDCNESRSRDGERRTKAPTRGGWRGAKVIKRSLVGCSFRLDRAAPRAFGRKTQC